MKKDLLPTKKMLNTLYFQRLVTLYRPFVRPEEMYSYLYEEDFPNNPCFTDFGITLSFPIPKGTKYSKGINKEYGYKWQGLVFNRKWLPYLKDSHFIDYYYERCQYLIENPPTKKMFKEHSFFLIKESLKAFSPYCEKAKELLAKLEQLK